MDEHNLTKEEAELLIQLLAGLQIKPLEDVDGAIADRMRSAHRKLLIITTDQPDGTERPQ